MRTVFSIYVVCAALYLVINVLWHDKDMTKEQIDAKVRDKMLYYRENGGDLFLTDEEVEDLVRRR